MRYSFSGELWQHNASLYLVKASNPEVHRDIIALCLPEGANYTVDDLNVFFTKAACQMQKCDQAPVLIRILDAKLMRFRYSSVIGEAGKYSFYRYLSNSTTESGEKVACRHIRVRALVGALAKFSSCRTEVFRK